MVCLVESFELRWSSVSFRIEIRQLIMNVAILENNAADFDTVVPTFRRLCAYRYAAKLVTGSRRGGTRKLSRPLTWTKGSSCLVSNNVIVLLRGRVCITAMGMISSSPISTMPLSKRTSSPACEYMLLLLPHFNHHSRLTFRA